MFLKSCSAPCYLTSHTIDSPQLVHTVSASPIRAPTPLLHTYSFFLSEYLNTVYLLYLCGNCNFLEVNGHM